MLVLSRDCNTVIRIGPDIRIKVLAIRKQRVKLGVDAPSNVRIWREEISPETSPSLPPSTDAALSGNFPILVIEDDPTHAKLISKVLTDSSFSEVIVASTGSRAMEMLGSNDPANAPAGQPHLVLLDLHLPDIPGLDVLRHIRSIDRLATTPVVVLSNEQHDAMVADCLQAGANAFVNKSSQFREFRDSVIRIASFWRTECRLPA